MREMLRNWKEKKLQEVIQKNYTKYVLGINPEKTKLDQHIGFANKCMSYLCL